MDTTQIPSTGIHWLDIAIQVIGYISVTATALASLPYLPAKIGGPLAKIGIEYVPALLKGIAKLIGLVKKPDPNAIVETPVTTPETDRATGLEAGAAASAASKGPFRKS